MMLAQELFPNNSLPEHLANIRIDRITDDSRQAGPGALFVARSGSQTHGTAFLTQAKNAGAALTLGPLGSGADLEVNQVQEELIALLDRFHKQPAQAIKLCSVTGTNGKTTTAFLLHATLQAWSQAAALTGTVCQRMGDQEFPSQLTTPGLVDFYALLGQARDLGMKYLCFEASSHALHQGRLGPLQVETAIFTNLSQDHLDYHLDMEDYYQAKRLLFSQHLSPTGKAIVNIDDAWGQRLAQELGENVWTCSCKTSADLQLQQVNQDGLRPVYRIFGLGVDFQFSPLLPGDFNQENLLGAAGALLHLGVPTAQIIQAFEQATVPGRMQKIPHPQWHAFVDYAHTPDALERVLASLRPLCPGRIITVFGCGGDRDRTKRPLMAQAAEKWSDLVFATSDNPRTEDPQQILADIQGGFAEPNKHSIIADRASAIQTAVQCLTSQDILVVAGKGHEDYQIIGTQKHHFDDRIVTQKALEAHL